MLAAVPVTPHIGGAFLVTAPPGDLHRAFIVSGGAIRVLDLPADTLRPEPFLTVPFGGGSEGGLLGLAFHPDYAANGMFWVHHSRGFPFGDAVVARYRAIGDPLTATAADPASREEVINLGAFSNHYGGWIGFGPDGHLYVFTGDGTIPGRASDITDELRGKVLRLDVDGPDDVPGNEDDDGFPGDTGRLYTIPADNPFVGIAGDDEIWAYGLRNPWRNDIDPLTGDLFVADVGESSREEVSFLRASAPGSMPGDPGYTGGGNFGWPTCEGDNHPVCMGPGFVPPVVVYTHWKPVPPTNATGCSVTGGMVYRGCAIPELDGTYFFADYCSRRVFSMRYDGAAISDFRERTEELHQNGEGLGAITGFGRDGWGELYICAGPRVYRIVAATPNDVNGDSVADTCRCPADWNGDWAANSSDIGAFLGAWLAAVEGGTTGGDYNRSGVTDSADISAFLTSWLAALGGGC